MSTYWLREARRRVEAMKEEEIERGGRSKELELLDTIVFAIEELQEECS